MGARVVRVQLRHTVSVDYELTIEERGAPTRKLVVRVEFPDEIRAMFETSTWTRGISIMDAIERLGAEYVARLDSDGLLAPSDHDRGETYCLPLSTVRSGLEAVRAAVA